MEKRIKDLISMEFTDLSNLAKGKWVCEESSESGMKRRWEKNHVVVPPNVDLQLQHPLPSDWEQCLDLQSGRMYYVNRKTSRKIWNHPEEQKLDLELNISTGCSSINNNEQNLQQYSSSSSNMVALACSNCHLLVILSRSSPSCPNCKYVHSLASSPNI